MFLRSYHSFTQYNHVLKHIVEQQNTFQSNPDTVTLAKSQCLANYSGAKFLDKQVDDYFSISFD